MQDVFVATDKIAYLRQCLERYNGSTGYLVLFFAALIFIILKGSDKEKRIFIPMSVLMIATVYNPLFPHILSIFADINSEYYRFFWISPVIILVPFLITKLVLALSEGQIKHKKSVAVLLLITIILSSTTIFSSGMKLPENRYKIPRELIEISEIIHKDCEDEYSKAFFEYEYNMQIRQYDPKMLLTIDREDYITAITHDFTTEEMDERVECSILAALFRYQNVDMGRLLDALESTKTEYVVLTSASTMIPKLKENGLTEVARTRGHIILKYDIKERVPFELIDYSEVYREGL